MDDFFHLYVKKFVDYYSDADNPLTRLLLDSNLDETYSNFNDTSDVVGQVVCLKKAKTLLKTTAKEYLQTEPLNDYKQAVQSLVISLHQYVEDIKELKTFHQ